MNETAGLFKLSYPVWSVVWDGKKIRRRAETDLQRQMDMMCELGIGEVMTTGYHLEEDSDFDPDSETRHVGEMLRRRGLRANQHHSHVATFAEPGSDQGRVLEHFKRCLEWTANLTAPAMVIHLGKPFGRFPAGGDERELERLQRRYSLDAIVKLTMENLHLAGEYAAQCGVRICVENLPYGISTWGKLPEVVEGADSEAVGYCLDSGHAWCEGVDPARWVPVMGRKLFVTHLHDNHGSRDEHLSPGFGTISWETLILALRREFRGTINFEVNGWYDMPPLEGHRRAVEFWRTLEKLALLHESENREKGV